MDVLNNGAAAADVNEGLAMVDRMMQRMNQMVVINLDELDGSYCHVLLLDVSAQPFFRTS